MTRRVVAILLGCVFAVLLARVLFNYFDSLSQYATTDQWLTRVRIIRAVTQPDEVKISEGSHVSAGLFGHIAYAFQHEIPTHPRGYFAKMFDLRGNLLLPFAIGQVVITLLAAFGLAVLFWRFNGRGAWGLACGLVMIVGFPHMVAEAKVLKYDALSLTLSALALVFIALYARDRRWWARVAAFVAVALAMLEKDSSANVLVFLIVWDQFLAYTSGTRWRQRVLDAVAGFALAIGALCACAFVVVPAIRHEPARLVELFGEFGGYFGDASRAAFIAAPLSYAALILGARAWARGVTLSERVQRRALVAAQVIGLAVFVLALVWQTNDIFYWHLLSEPREVLNQFFRAGGVLSYPGAITTRDASRVITSGKLFLDHARLFVYQAPELTALCVLVLPLAILRLPALRRQGMVLAVFVSFALFHAFVASVLLVGVGGKYTMLPWLILTGVAVMVVNAALESLPRWRLPLLAVAALGVAHPVFGAAPAHFAFLSAFRSRAVENHLAEPGQMQDWTWVGWGEAPYPLLLSLDHAVTAPVVVGVDYAAQFRPFTYVDQSVIDTRTLREDVDLTQWSCAQARATEYLAVSKVTTFRFPGVYRFLATYRDRARAVAVHDGLELAWLFRLSDLCDRLE